jgi:hypothetical protein
MTADVGGYVLHGKPSGRATNGLWSPVGRVVVAVTLVRMRPRLLLRLLQSVPVDPRDLHYLLSCGFNEFLYLIVRAQQK